MAKRKVGVQQRGTGRAVNMASGGVVETVMETVLPILGGYGYLQRRRKRKAEEKKKSEKKKSEK